jgi:hypothetical protein
MCHRFGPSLVTREGKSWRAHQKVIAPAFSEKNAKIVWEESLIQTEAMLQSWTNCQLGNSKYVETIREDTMTLPFHVINKAGFGVHLPWPTWKRAKDPFIHATGVDEIGPGHVMSYRQALQSAITHLFHILIFPDWLLRKYILLDKSLVQAGSDIIQDSYHLVMPNCCAWRKSFPSMRGFAKRTSSKFTQTT